MLYLKLYKLKSNRNQVYRLRPPGTRATSFFNKYLKPFKSNSIVGGDRTIRVYNETKIVGGRVDYLVKLNVGVEVKSLEEIITSPERVVEQISRYAEGLDALILLIDISEPSDIAVQYIREIVRKLPSNVIVAYGNPLNALTWRAVRDVSLLDVIKGSIRGD